VTKQEIRPGDCLDVLADLRNVPAIVADPPANISFMGRSWDRAHPVDDYVLPCVPRSKAHERELRSEESFIRYWSTRYAMAYDIADQHATAIIWTLPRTSYQTAHAMRRAGWFIKDEADHWFGTGWAKDKNALAPGHEKWIIATKGKPDLDIDACRVPRGERDLRANTDGNEGLFGMGSRVAVGTTSLGSIPKNALLSHCEECVRVGVKRIKSESGGIRDNRGKPHGILTAAGQALRDDVSPGYGSTESVPAWHCLAGCVCGARSKWDPEKPLPRCPCGEVWRWLCAVAEVNGQSGETSVTGERRNKLSDGRSNGLFAAHRGNEYANDRGGASRFFNTFSYLSKCASGERHAGCESLFWRANKKNPFGFDQVTREEWWAATIGERLGGKTITPDGAQYAQGNVHPTVKSYRLMHWLHSLTGAKRIVDLCAGSGTGMLTAALDGIEWIGAEVCPEAVTIAKARHAFWAGLSFEARRAMVENDIVPPLVEIDERQVSLF
jgi:hypothetical protein